MFRVGKVQEEELDSCRVSRRAKAGTQADEGAGRNQHGFSLPIFAGEEMKGGECAAPR